MKPYLILNLSSEVLEFEKICQKTRIVINSITFDSLVQKLGTHKLANKFSMIPKVQQRLPQFAKVKLWSQKKRKKKKEYFNI
jgi:hypothetical protein